MAKILIVEDDKDLCAMIVDRLKSEHHTVEAVHDGHEGDERLRFYSYDFVILDWDLPNKPGVQICKDFRGRGGVTPVLMLTGKSEEKDKELGLDSGADDYLTKPFSIRELAARIRAVLRRPTGYSQDKLSEGGVSLDVVSHTVTVGDKSVHLHPKEFAILELMMRHRNQVFSPTALLDRVWASEADATAETLRTTIKRLRQKIDPPGEKNSVIKTVHGVGYKVGDD